jgi:hypothetical protein
MIAEIRRIIGAPGTVVQLIYKDKDGRVEKVRQYDGEVARVLLEVIDYSTREDNEVK